MKFVASNKINSVYLICYLVPNYILILKANSVVVSCL